MTPGDTTRGERPTSDGGPLAARPSSQAAGAPRLLVVEDDPVVRRFLADALTRASYNIRAAGDGQSALVELLGWRPDVVLLDLIMPRMNGWDFARACNTMPGRRPRIVLISALGPAALEAAREIGAWHILPKPFDLDELLELLEIVTTVRAA
jgi:CheY-like chemotaxis protein